MITISDWLKSYQDLPQVTVHFTRQVEGVCKIVTGARSLFAKVGITISPSDNLIFEHSLNEVIKKRSEDEKWIEYFCLGVLDMMLAGPPTPICCFQCNIDYIEYHDIDSTKQAFRLAGRDAARNFLSQENFNKVSY